MAPPMYKCFMCGKVYKDEASAIKCHNAPVQCIAANEKAPKPRFLGN